MRRLAVALSVAVAAAGIFAAPVGGGSKSTKPQADVTQAPAQQIRLCKQF
jgi:hypothetical protein